MSILLEKGRYRARQSRLPEDVAKAQALRARAFGCDDRDGLDARCAHILVEDLDAGDVLCSFRMLLLHPTEVDQSYSAQFYDLAPLRSFDGPLVEMGRFCTHPEHKSDPDVLRMAWGAFTTFVDAAGVQLMFGCSSFEGTEPEQYHAGFAALRARHLAPETLRPKIKAPQVVRFDALAREIEPCMRLVPSLLRTYLTMGGWVSDHAVIDPRMNTIHVFTGVEVRKIPEARKRLLRAVVG